jgi:hypothetical protein
MIVVVRGPEQMDAVNAADNLFCRFKMEGCPYCTNTQADWDGMCASAEPNLAPGTVIAEIESKMAPLFRAKTAAGADYSVNQFPTYSFFKRGVFKGEVKNARKKGELLTVLKKRRFLKKRGTRARKPFRKQTRKI